MIATLAHDAQGLVTIQYRHIEIHQYRRDFRSTKFQQPCERSFAITRGYGFYARLCQDITDQLPDVFNIVHYEDAARNHDARSQRRRHALRQTSEAGDFIETHYTGVDPDDETTAATFDTVRRNRSTQFFGQFLADRQAKTRSFILAWRELRERRKDFIEVTSADAFAGIEHMKLEEFVIHLQLQFHGTFFRELDGVAKQVEQYLPQAHRIALDKTRQHSARTHLQCQVFCFGHFPDQ